jgi:hypothetical protein
MLGNRRIIADTFCEVYDLLEPLIDDHFWDFENHVIESGAVYLIGRAQLFANLDKVRTMVEHHGCLPILSNPSEGSSTLRWHAHLAKLTDLLLDRRMLLIGGGDIDSDYHNLRFDTFMCKIGDYDENNIAAKRTDEIFVKTDKPFTFLFLNGRARPQRKYLIERFDQLGLLQNSLWTCLEGHGFNSRVLKLQHNDKNLMTRSREIRYLPAEYEVPAFRPQLELPLPNEQFVKYHLFNDTWGEIYLQPEPYIDTYFSVVTETVFEYPYSFRTEKIWKPIMMGHPWIAVSNCGYYRDIRNLGFRTFDSIIDESFDLIDDNQRRIERIAQVVQDLCQQNLAEFLQATREVCKYNQQHLTQLRHQARSEFPDRFTNFLQPYLNNE